MAAPSIHSSLKKANLSSLLSRDNTPKATRKNILCPVFHEWPRAPKAVEESILSKLTEKLSGEVNVFKPSKKSSTEDQPEKARIRSQLEIGASCVFRALERRTLSCILVSGQATPAISVDHIISLAREQGCPLLCLNQLSPTIARATQSKCFPLAIGFKRMEDNSHADFAEIISLVKENVTVQSSPSARLNISTDMASRESVARPRTSKYTPLRISANMGTEILKDLKRALSGALVAGVEKKSKDKKNKKQKKKRNLKDVFNKSCHCQFDIGKRTVTGILERGKLQLILVTEQIVPVLLSEADSCSLLSLAAVKRCPVVVLPGLMDAMKGLCDGMVSVLGLKKLNSIQGSDAIFQAVVDKCLLALGSLNKQRLLQTEQDGTAPKVDTVSYGEPYAQSLVEEIPVINIAKDATKVDDDVVEVSSTILEPEDNEATDDYSYLYILKKDSKELIEVKRELNTAVEVTKNIAVPGEFISFTTSLGKSNLKTPSLAGKTTINAPSPGASASKKPKTCNPTPVETKLIGEESSPPTAVNWKPHSDVETMDSSDIDIERKVHPRNTQDLPKDTVTELPMFSICRSGNNSNTKSTLVKPQHTERQSSASKHKDTYALGIEGLSQPDKSKTIDYLSFDVSSKSGKKAQKRKLHNSDTFISFAYTEANIQTMTSDPSKKKKKKKNKKA